MRKSAGSFAEEAPGQPAAAALDARLARLVSKSEEDLASDLDTLSDPTASGLAIVASWCGQHVDLESHALSALRLFGDRLGRTLYLVDALNDLRSDRASGEYAALHLADLWVQAQVLRVYRCAQVLEGAVIESAPDGEDGGVATPVEDHSRGSHEELHWRIASVDTIQGVSFRIQVFYRVRR